MELSPGIWGLLPLVLVALIFALNQLYRRWRRYRQLTRPFPQSWVDSLNDTLAIYPRLETGERNRLHQMIHVFLDEKTFYGCAGFEVTEEVQVTIAAQACLLCLGKNVPLYPKLQSILVYPDAFIASRDVYGDNGVVADAQHHLLGESWDNGRIILSWADTVAGANNFSDGKNVVLHEFAHQLDSGSGVTNGAPPLWRNSYQSWATVFSDNFEDLRSRVQRKLPTIIDDYGATNEAEFFAVATETFFERPGELAQRRPDLFDELLQYYQIDPRRWHR